MSRGGKPAERDVPERRCIATGLSGPTDRLIRFVLGPGGTPVPDLAEKLPGRGVWLTSDPAEIDKAVRKRLFSRAFRAPAEPPEGLGEMIERLLVDRLVNAIALARKAGQAVTGFEKVRARLGAGPAGALITARGAAEDGRTKLARLGGETPRIDVLDPPELGLAFGREFAIHAALDVGRLAGRALREAQRLDAFRSGAAAGASTGRDGARHGEPAPETDTATGPQGGPEWDDA